MEKGILNKFCSRMLGRAVVIISKGLFLYKRYKKCFKLHGMYVSSVADLGRTTKTNVLRLGQNATDRTRKQQVVIECAYNRDGSWDTLALP